MLERPLLLGVAFCFGLTLCGEVLTLEGEFRAAHCQSCGGFPEFTIAMFIVCGLVGAGGGGVLGAGRDSSESISSEPVS